MSVFLLVHGAWHTSWCFDDVIAALRLAGHDAIAPDLPNMGGTDAELSAVTLEAWGRFIADLARSSAEPVLLCGHSRAGSVISTAAEMEPDTIKALVYVAGFMLGDGDSPAAFKARQPVRNPFADAISVVGDNAGTRVDPRLARDFFYNTADASAGVAASQRLVAEPFLPSRTQLHLTAERFGRVPRYFVECTQDRVISLDEQQQMQADLPVQAVERLDCDHSPFLSAKDPLVAALLRIAGHAADALERRK